MAGAVGQVKEAFSATAATTLASGTLASDVTAGNFLWIIANADDNVSITPTQNSGSASIGTITSRGSVVEAALSDRLEHFTAPINGTGSLDILITYGASTGRRGVLVVEVTGVTAYQGDHEQTDTGSNPTPTLTFNVTSAPAFGLSFATFYQGGQPGQGTSWTDFGALFWETMADAMLQTRAISATGNVNANFVNASLDRNNSCMVVFTEPPPPDNPGARRSQMRTMPMIRGPR